MLASYLVTDHPEDSSASESLVLLLSPHRLIGPIGLVITSTFGSLLSSTSILSLGSGRTVSQGPVIPVHEAVLVLMFSTNLHHPA